MTKMNIEKTKVANDPEIRAALRHELVKEAAMSLKKQKFKTVLQFVTHCVTNWDKAQRLVYRFTP
jgi:uncharacterized membrane-anchored protein YjiN (DUF445 family)